MARVYSRRKGKAGSKKPLRKTPQSWLRYQSKEIEMLITKMAKEDQLPSRIGLHLRDVYGIPDVKMVTGKSISQMLKEKGLLHKIPEDLSSLIKRSIQIRKHMEKNKKDMTAKRGLQITESKINRLVKYYKRNRVLPADWKYDRTKAGIFI